MINLKTASYSLFLLYVQQKTNKHHLRSVKITKCKCSLAIHLFKANKKILEQCVWKFFSVLIVEFEQRIVFGIFLLPCAFIYIKYFLSLTMNKAFL